MSYGKLHYGKAVFDINSISLSKNLVRLYASAHIDLADLPLSGEIVCMECYGIDGSLIFSGKHFINVFNDYDRAGSQYVSVEQDLDIESFRTIR
jgi:hypothetical protein